MLYIFGKLVIQGCQKLSLEVQQVQQVLQVPGTSGTITPNAWFYDKPDVNEATYDNRSLSNTGSGKHLPIPKLAQFYMLQATFWLLALNKNISQKHLPCQISGVQVLLLSQSMGATYLYFAFKNIVVTDYIKIRF